MLLCSHCKSGFRHRSYHNVIMFLLQEWVRYQFYLNVPLFSFQEWVSPSVLSQCHYVSFAGVGSVSVLSQCPSVSFSGVGFAISLITVPLMTSQYFRYNKAKATAVICLGNSVGIFTLPVVITLLMDAFSFTGCMLITGEKQQKSLFGTIWLINPLTAVAAYIRFFIFY